MGRWPAKDVRERWHRSRAVCNAAVTLGLVKVGVAALWRGVFQETDRARY
jgi:hypothetical protein